MTQKKFRKHAVSDMIVLAFISDFFEVDHKQVLKPSVFKQSVQIYILTKWSSRWTVSLRKRYTS
jgi:hypothetical protein